MNYFTAFYKVDNASIEGLFVMKDWHNISADYYKALMAWHNTFVKHWHELKHHYD
jgi:cyclopropane-fatty-acyl-phospholipid synthase